MLLRGGLQKRAVRLVGLLEDLELLLRLVRSVAALDLALQALVLLLEGADLLLVLLPQVPLLEELLGRSLRLGDGGLKVHPRLAPLLQLLDLLLVLVYLGVELVTHFVSVKEKNNHKCK